MISLPSRIHPLVQVVRYFPSDFRKDLVKFKRHVNRGFLSFTSHEFDEGSRATDKRAPISFIAEPRRELFVVYLALEALLTEAIHYYFAPAYKGYVSKYGAVWFSFCGHGPLNAIPWSVFDLVPLKAVDDILFRAAVVNFLIYAKKRLDDLEEPEWSALASAMRNDSDVKSGKHGKLFVEALGEFERSLL